ncbi:MAG: GNAT family N-acetyltransferase [Pseudolabrys sp.]
MTIAYDISLATPDDISGILVLQEPNLPDSGGSLSVRLTEDWFRQAISEKSVVVGRRDGKVVGYVLGTSLAAQAHVAIIQTMLRSFPPPADCYLYGPVCVAQTERGKGLAAAMFKTLQKYKDGRPAMAFVRADNEVSLRAHKKMGMERLGTFVNDTVPYIALRYAP